MEEKMAAAQADAVKFTEQFIKLPQRERTAVMNFVNQNARMQEMLEQMSAAEAKTA